MKRRSFITKSAQSGLAVTLLGTLACRENKARKPADDSTVEDMTAPDPFFKLSLAQWSVHRMIIDGKLDPYQFAAKSREWGFTGLEYVSQLYSGTLQPAGFSDRAMQDFVERCNTEAQAHGQQNVLIMIDGEGDLAISEAAVRQTAVMNHIKWIDAAAGMGCQSIRVNLAGSSEPETWISNSVDGLSRLTEYSGKKNINVLVENHGGLSSNAALLAEVMSKVDSEFVGTLPDFGNFCIASEYGVDAEGNCIEAYDPYKGVSELLPFAKAVSAKSYDFDDEGNETNIDYQRMLQLVKDSGYTGFIGVEYEGNRLSEVDGIAATRDLLLKVASKLS